MDRSESAQGLPPTFSALARSKEGALGRVWDKVDAGLIGVHTNHPAGTNSPIRSPSTEFHANQRLQTRHRSTSPNAQRQTYGRRVLPPRETSLPTPTTNRTLPPSSQLPHYNDYIPRLDPHFDSSTVLPSTSNIGEPRHRPIQPDAVPLDNESFMMNVSPLFTNASDGFVGQQDGLSPQHVVRVSPTVPRYSVERPSPRLQPYPHASPGTDGSRGTFASEDANRVPDDDPRKVLIIPGHPNRFKPKKTGVDIGFDCMAKHWVAGWTTIQYCDESAKEQWFEEFKARLTWNPKHTTEIKRIFFEKCRKKLNDGWYNVRQNRCKEGLKFLKRHEVDAGLIWYIRNADLVEKISARNKINSKGIEARVHRGGAKGTDEVYEELVSALESLGLSSYRIFNNLLAYHCFVIISLHEITLEVVYCRDMYNRLKRKPDGSYLCEDGQEKADLLEAAHNRLSREYNGRVPQALDFEIGSKILGENKRTKLPKYIASAATLVEGSKFQRIASQRIASSDNRSSTELQSVAEQVTQLQQQQNQMLQILQQQQQVIVDLKEALLNAKNGQPPCRESDSDMQSSE